MAIIQRPALVSQRQGKRPISSVQDYPNLLATTLAAAASLEIELLSAKQFDAAPQRPLWRPDCQESQGFIIHEVYPEIVSLNDSAPRRVSRLSFDQPLNLLGTTLAQFLLQVEDASHAHTVDGLTLQVAGTLEVADAAHAHTVDNIDLVQANVLAVADALHAHAADNIALTQANVLVVSESSHGHTVDSLTLSTGLQLELQDALHAHLADQPSLTQGHVLVVSDALHAHLADLVSIFDPAALIVNDALHAHLCDALGIARVTDATRRVIVVAVNRTVRVH